MTRTSGFATSEGTRHYARRFDNSPAIAPEHYRTFLGLTLSSLGLGTYLGNPDGETDRQVADAAVASVESGAINVLDTAINYRFQKAERSVGAAIERLSEKGIARNELFVCSKNGYLTPDADVAMNARDYFRQEFIAKGVMRVEDIAGGCHCMTPAYLEDQLNRSLANLGLETLDLMYLHNAAESQIPAVGRNAFMDRLQAAFVFYESQRKTGKIRYYGLATWDCFRVEPAEATSYLSLETVVKLAEETGGPDHGFRFVQLPFNLAFIEAGTLHNQDVDGTRTTFLQAAEQLGIGVFTSVPLLQGQLLQHRMPAFEGLKTPAQRCLQMARSHRGILAPLVGMKDPAHVEDNLRVASVAPATGSELKESLAAL